MKGTEKQIKWAEDIINAAQATIDANIKRNEGDDPMNVNERKIWEWVKGEYDKAMQMVGGDAKLIIDNRKRLDADAMIHLAGRVRCGYIKI